MSANAPICVQIAALGGQGGGVLAEWLAEAARHGGYPAQVTSIPGVAQRTGATTYYFEMYPEPGRTQKPVFCLSPDADGLDLMVAMEPLEAVRALDLGLITKRTTVLTATGRIYSTTEKSYAGDGVIANEALFEALSAAKTVIGMDLDACTSQPGAPGNAAMFGAIAASAILPLTEEDFRQAIRIKGIAVETSLAEFSAGHAGALSTGGRHAQNTSLTFDPPPDGINVEIGEFPESLRALVGHACARLTDYQDQRYARLYLERLGPFVGGPGELALEVAGRLGSWMAYEDVIRVAQLKTQAGRLARIRGEIGIDETAPLTVVEFLKPGREELASLMPPVLGKIMMRGHRISSTSGLRLRLTTTTAFGYGALKVLAALRGWRPRTFRYKCEQQAIARWLAAIEIAMKTHPELAFQAARLAVLARGYGGVRARGMEKMDHLFRDWQRRLEDDPQSLASDVDRILLQAGNDPDGDCGTRP